MNETTRMVQLVNLATKIHEAIEQLDNLVALDETEWPSEFYEDLRNLLKPAYWRVVQEGSEKLHISWTA